MSCDTVILKETHNHRLTIKSFDRLLAKDLGTKWSSFSDQTKEDIWEYFHYLRGLVEIHDTDSYDNWNYWQDAMTEFVRKFDENHPYYDGNFERVVLRVPLRTQSSSKESTCGLSTRRLTQISAKTCR